ncbi:MAG: NADH-quinone oxidoreductase subunit M [Crocinitomicaceae bacterium]|nr:NADH-quinone oxidoreductase subunit M [Crocinitomicaceae bacterium]
MLTILLIILPVLCGAALVLLKTKTARMFALGTSLVQLLLTLAAVYLWKTGNNALVVFDKGWLGSMGVHCAFSLDGISLVMALLSAIITPLIIYASFNKSYKNPHIFYGLILMMSGAMMGAFTATDGLVFYIFYEVALIPIYFISMIWGSGNNKVKVTLKFFLYTIFGSLFMLVALLYVYQHTYPHSFQLSALYEAGRSLSGLEQGLVFAGLFIAFAVKMPVFPFHTWQPSTYDVSPTPGTMLLAAIMLKMATYGLVRLAVPMVPDGVTEYGTWAMVLSIAGIVYASCVAIVQKRYKLLIAYSSIAHVGLISAGILASNEQGIVGALFEMVSHGILAVGMFFIYDIVETRLKSDEMARMGGIREANPLFASLFLVLVMGSIALPFTSGFVGEFLLLQGLAIQNIYFAVFGGLTVILSAVYLLRAFQTMMLGKSNIHTAGFSPLTTHEKTVLIIVVLLVIGLGLYPSPLLDLANSSVQTLPGISY